MKVRLVSDHGDLPKGTVVENPKDLTLDMAPLDMDALKTLNDFWQGARQCNCLYGYVEPEDPFGENTKPPLRPRKE